MKYRKRSPVVDAIRYTGYNMDELAKFSGLKYDLDRVTRDLVMKTDNGDLDLEPNSYLIKDSDGKFTTCDAFTFNMEYEYSMPAEWSN